MFARLLAAAMATFVVTATASAAPMIGNASFETPDLMGGFQYNPSGATFTFAGGAGIAANDSGFGVSGATGNQAGFLQQAGSSISQSVAGFDPGIYTLSFIAEGRTGLGPNPFQVSIDGTLLTFGGSPTITPGTGAFNTFTSDPFLVLSPSATLAFTGQGVAGADVTSFIDTPSFALIATVPEPATLAVFGCIGLAGLGYARRRKVTAA